MYRDVFSTQNETCIGLVFGPKQCLMYIVGMYNVYVYVFNIHSVTNEKSFPPFRLHRLSKSLGGTRAKAEYCTDNRESRDDGDRTASSLLHACPLSPPSDPLGERRGGGLKTSTTMTKTMAAVAAETFNHRRTLNIAFTLSRGWKSAKR